MQNLTSPHTIETQPAQSLNDRLGAKQYLIAFLLAVVVPAISAFSTMQVSQAKTDSRIESLETDSKAIRSFITENKQERREQIAEIKSVVITRPEFEAFVAGQKRELDVRFDANDKMLNLIYSEVNASRK